MPRFSHTLVKHRSNVEIVKEVSKDYKKGATDAYEDLIKSNGWARDNYSGFYSKDLGAILYIEDGGYMSDYTEGPFVPIFHQHYTFAIHEQHRYRVFVLFVTQFEDFSLDPGAISLDLKGERYGLFKSYGPIIARNVKKANEYFSKHKKHLPDDPNDPVIMDTSNYKSRVSDQCQDTFKDFGKGNTAYYHEYCYLLEFNIQNINPQNTFYITLDGMNAGGMKLEQLKLKLSDQVYKEYRMLEIHM